MLPLVVAMAFLSSMPDPAEHGGCVRTPAAETAPRTLTIRANPWADIIVDGAVIARGSKTVSITLAPGVHAVRLENPLARTVERAVMVPAAGPVADVVVALERRSVCSDVHAVAPAIPARVGLPRQRPSIARS